MLLLKFLKDGKKELIKGLENVNKIITMGKKKKNLLPLVRVDVN